MQRPFLRTRSAGTYLTLAFSFLIVLTFLFAVALPPSSTATPGQPGGVSKKPLSPEFVPGEVLVRYRSERIAKRQTLQTLASADGRQLSIQVERFEGADIVPGLRLAHVAAADTMAAIEALKNQPDVLYAEPNYLLHLDLTPNDPRFTSNELYGLTKIGAPAAWDTTTGATGNNRIVVGIIDEGIDGTHPDLGANIWVNPAEVAGNGVDDDANGLIDDVNGYNFSSNSGTIPAENHATHVAGTIGAVGNNNTGVVGVNWQVGLMSLRFIGGTSGATSDAIRATNYAKQMRDLWVSTGGLKGANVRVLNNSYGGGGFNQSFVDAITNLGSSGILFVAAAGNAPDSPQPDNDLVPHYPGSYDVPNVIAVAATDSNDALASFSHFGLTTVHIGAPGASILSTTTNNTYSLFNGTSMATPHVAGAAALLLAANPNLTVQQVKALLLFNGDSVPSLAGKTTTGRRLSVSKSMQALNGNDVTPPGTPTNFHVNSQNGRTLNVGWTASGDDGAVGQAAQYQLSFTDATTGTVIPLKSVSPATSGTTEAVDVKLPYRHTGGTLTLREFDNSGNEGVPTTTNVSVSLLEGDPYVTSLGNSVALSTGGTALALIGDDKLKLNYALPFSFPFFGENFTTVNISTNGNLFFSAPPTRQNGDADDVPSSVLGLAKFKMISGLWDDIRTDRGVGQDVYAVTPDASRIIFRWQGVTFGNGSPSTEFPVNFEIELRSNGTILTRYGTGQAAPVNTNLLPVVGIAGGEPDPYDIPSHTSKQTFKTLTNAQEVTFLPRANSALSNVQFSVAQFNISEGATPVIATVTVNRAGDTSAQASVDFTTADGSATQKGDYTFAVGRITFAAGETSKTFPVLIINDSLQEGPETFSVILNNPQGTVLGARNVAAIAIADNDASTGTNPLDNPDADFFVRQHYLDFLGREPDAGGLAFWKNQITSCGADAACIEVRRINVSAAFFLSIEFQETGYLVYRLYKAGYGNIPGAPVPLRYAEFLPDAQQIALGVQVGIGNWQAVLEANKVAFTNDFVTRARFSTAYPTTLTPTQFVNALVANAGFTPTSAELQAFIGEFGTNTNTVDTAARARALRAIAENGTFNNQEKNRAFVLMEYFGYMRRNPYDPPEATLDYAGYNFWLGKLNQFNGNFVEAEMVKAFIVSGEYRHRFGP
jgi:subtilisin family serine protease